MALDKLDPTKTALVVIDLQNGVVAMPVAPHSAAAVVSRTSDLATAFRNAKSPVFLVRVKFAADGKDSIPTIVDQPRVAPNPLPEGWSEIVAELGPRDGDVVITKKNWGAFYGTELELQLRRRGIDTIVLTGISTNMGVESTARNAHELSFNILFAADAISAMSEADHEYALTRIFPRIGRVSSTTEILAALS